MLDKWVHLLSGIKQWEKYFENTILVVKSDCSKVFFGYTITCSCSKANVGGSFHKLPQFASYICIERFYFLLSSVWLASSAEQHAGKITLQNYVNSLLLRAFCLLSQGDKREYAVENCKWMNKMLFVLVRTNVWSAAAYKWHGCSTVSN